MNWVPINDHPGDQRYDAVPGTDDTSYWGEIGPDHPTGWTWTIIAHDNAGNQWDADGGKAGSEAEAKMRVETWQPYQGWEQVGTVEILRLRIYGIDPYSDGPLRTTVAVEPGVYPVYRKYDAYCWLMTGRVNERNAKIGDGLFELNAGDKPQGLPVQFPSTIYGQEQFAELLSDEACQPGPQQRLRFTLQPLALP